MRYRKLGVGGVLLAFVASGWVGEGMARATVPADLCTGNPCIVAADATLDPTDSLDFGASTELRIATGVTLTIAPGTTSPSVWLSAGTVILEPGAGIVAREGSLTLEAVAGNLELQRSGSGMATIRFRGLADTPPSGPRADLSLSAQGTVVIDGAIVGKVSDPYAGMDLVDIIGTSVIGVGRIDVRSLRMNELSLRPTVQLYAVGAVDFGGKILAGAGCTGGDVIVRSETGPIAVGFVDATARGCPAAAGYGLGGSVLVTGAGEARLLDGLDARGRGDGGSVRLDSDASHVAGKVDLRGLKGVGGTFRADGGDFIMDSGSEVRLTGRAGGGQAEIIASSFITAGDARLTSIRDAGSVQATAAGTLTVERRLRTRGQNPGPIELEACGAVTIGSDAVVDTRSAGGATGNDITVRGDAITVDGDLLATGGAVALDYYTTPPAIAGTVEPTPTIVQVAPPAGCTP
jgi:hypothetical protein